MPATDTQKRVVPAQDVNQGESTGRVRTVLHISLALALIAGVVIWAIYVL